jgi:glyoxylase-like metal-dependent hydrolase (beta-lactamase superfamily II)
MCEVATGVWHWKAAHPEWKPGRTWDLMVSSYAVDSGGDTLPFGVHAFEGFEPNDLVLYVESRRAVVVGDTLIDRGTGLRVHPDWPGPGVAAAEVVRRLRPLLDLPVDVVVPTHADPADRAVLERALSL